MKQFEKSFGERAEGITKSHSKQLHETMESRKAEMHEHLRVNKAGKGETSFGDTKTAKDRKMKKKGLISRILNKFK